VIERVRELGFADALGLAALGLVAAGLIVTGDGLVTAARATPGSSVMSWSDRLLLGLWSFRLEHTLWFTIGLLLLWLALGLGATLEGRAEQAARAAGGVAVGFVLLAGAVVAGSTIVAVTGSVGSGALQVTPSNQARFFTWLLQVSSAAALSVAWLVAGSRLGERFAFAQAAMAAEVPDDEDDEDGLSPDGLEELSDLPPEPPPPVPLPERPAPRPVALADRPPAAAPPDTAAGRAQRVYQERLAYSPNREEARRLIEELRIAEREGREGDVEQLAARIHDL
jgi:hypothetical protein